MSECEFVGGCVKQGLLDQRIKVNARCPARWPGRCMNDVDASRTRGPDELSVQTVTE